MNFLLDTIVISEPTKPRPNPGVLEWLAETDEETLFLCAITIAELRYGIERLPAGRRRAQLDQWLDRGLRARFGQRILAIDDATADLCGRLMAASQGKGRQIEVRDALIAACAKIHGLTLATRNVSDFGGVLEFIKMPWTRRAPQ